IKAFKSRTHTTRIGNLKCQTRATDDGKPKTSDERRNDTNGGNQLSNRTTTRDTSNKDGHHRTIPQEPTPKEYCPTTKPAFIAAIRCHRNKVMHHGTNALDITIDNKLRRAKHQNKYHEGKSQYHVKAA